MPFGFTDARAFKFDLFSLELAVIERLEQLLLKQESTLNKQFDSGTSNDTNNASSHMIPGATHATHKERKSIGNSSSALYSNSKTPSNGNSSFNAVPNGNVSTSTVATNGKNGLRQTTTNQIMNNSNSNSFNNINSSKTKEIKTNIIK